jgi:hypothetical protein
LDIDPAATPFFDNIPGQVSFSFAPSTQNPPSQTLKLLNAGAGTLNWTRAASTADTSAWLTATPTSGTAPSTVTVGVVTQRLPGQGLVPGTFIGQVLLQGQKGNVSVPVSVEVGDPVFVQLPTVTFTAAQGTNPPPQDLNLASTSTAINFTPVAVASKGGNWLSVSPSGTGCCSTPETITASVNSAGLPQGTYIGEITFYQYPSNTEAMTVPVILTVTP